MESLPKQNNLQIFKKGVFMETITEIKAQSNDKSRVSLYLNGKFFCGLDLETAVKNKLKVGTIITTERLTAIQTESEKQTAYSKALKLISTRYKTQKEVEKYLYEKGYLAPTIYYVIEKLVEYHYIDDERYVDSYISSHKETCGKLKLKQQLMQKGVSEALIDQKLDDEDFNQLDEISNLAQKYMKSKEDTKENNIKLFKYLMSKGFSFEEIKTALKKEVE
jgi:regulatory protein